MRRAMKTLGKRSGNCFAPANIETWAQQPRLRQNQRGSKKLVRQTIIVRACTCTFLCTYVYVCVCNIYVCTQIQYAHWTYVVCMHVCVCVCANGQCVQSFLPYIFAAQQEEQQLQQQQSGNHNNKKKQQKTTQRDWGGAANGRKHSAHFASAAFVIIVVAVVIEKRNNVQQNQSGICKKQLFILYLRCRPLPACEGLSKTTPLVSSGEHVFPLSRFFTHAQEKRRDLKQRTRRSELNE